MVRAFDGRLSVSLKWRPGPGDKPDDGLTVSELAQMGVARISVGPALTLFAMAEYEKRARELLEQD
jgi:2-methylisocitrate lyase-like PEP mutase family enzyme